MSLYQSSQRVDLIFPQQHQYDRYIIRKFKDPTWLELVTDQLKEIPNNSYYFTKPYVILLLDDSGKLINKVISIVYDSRTGYPVIGRTSFNDQPSKSHHVKAYIYQGYIDNVFPTELANAIHSLDPDNPQNNENLQQQITDYVRADLS